MTDLVTLGLYVDSSGVVRATDHLNKFGKEGQRAEGIADKFGKTGKLAFGAIAAGATAALSAIAGIGSAISTIRQFETSMSQVSAITGATRSELESLRDVAKQLGSTTEFSAAQAADGLRFLGLAGFSAAESIKAIPAVLDLATASSMGLAESADIASNVLSGFGLAADQAGQVADVLAAASSRANTSVSQLGTAMSTVAPISAALGIDLADTAAAIGVLSDAGIQGERAGTALRAVLASLAGPTAAAQKALAEYGLTAAQVNPETQSLTEIFGLLAERGLSTADAMEIFGREAASGALVLTEAAQRVGAFGDELRDTEGAAADMAAIMRDNLAGSANSALSALQGLAIALGEAGLTAVLRAGLRIVTEFARKLTDVAGSVGDFFAMFQGKDEIQAAFERATDNVTIALGDQIRQLGQLQQAMENSGAISLAVAESRLAEAEAIREVIAAEKEQLVQKTLLEAGYAELLGRLEATRSAMRGVNAALSEGDGAAAMQVESFRQLEKTMISLLEEQQAMLASARENVKLTEEQEQALSDAEKAASTLRNQIQNMKDGLVLVNGQWVDVVTLSDRAAARAEAASAAARGLAASLSGAAAQARVLVANLGLVPTALGNLAERVASQVESMTQANAALRDQIDNGTDASIAAIKAERNALLNRMELEGADMVAQSEAIKRFDDKIAVLEGLTGANKALTTELANTTRATGKAGGAAKGAAKDFQKLREEVERLNLDADPLAQYNAGLERLNELSAQGLSEAAYSTELAKMNEELVNASPLLSGLNDAFGQFIDQALSGFKDGMRGIFDIFKNTLKQMIATALKNRITIGLGIAASGGAGAAAAQVPGGGLSSLFGGGGFLGLGGGAGSLFGGSGLLGLGGGSSIFGLGAGSGLATALGGGAFGAAASVALPIIGAIAGIGLLFKKTEVVVANGVNAIIEGAEIAVQSYEKSKTNNGLGISSGFKRKFTDLDDAVQSAVQARLDATIDALGSFGLGTDLTGFNYSKRTEIKDGETFEGELEEVISGVISEALTFLSDGTLEAFQNVGEDLSTTLTRLTTSLQVVNDTSAAFGAELLPISLEAADAASALIELSGGLDAFAAQTAFLAENFFTDDQKLAENTKQLNVAFRQLGLTVPETHQQFLDLRNAQDLMTEEGRNLHAALSALAPLFVTVRGTAQEAFAQVQEDVTALYDTLLGREADAEGFKFWTDAIFSGAVTLDEAARLISLSEEAQAFANAAEDIADGVATLNDAVAQERIRLENQLANLIGDTAFLRERELDALDESNRSLQQAIYLIQDENAQRQQNAATVRERIQLLREERANYQALIDEARSALVALGALPGELTPLQRFEEANAAYENALEQLSSAIDREKGELESKISGLESEASRLREALFPDETIDPIDALRVQDVLGDSLALAEQLADIARDVLGQNVEIAEQQRKAALAQLQGMLAAGSIDVDNVEEIARRASAFDTSQYATREEMQFDQLLTANTINELSELQAALADEAQAAEELRAEQARRTALDQLAALEEQIVQNETELTALNDLERQFGLLEEELSSGALVDQVTKLKMDAEAAKDAAVEFYDQQLEDNSLLLDGVDAEIDLLNSQLTALNSIQGALESLPIILSGIINGAISSAVNQAIASIPKPYPLPSAGGSISTNANPHTYDDPDRQAFEDSIYGKNSAEMGAILGDDLPSGFDAYNIGGTRFVEGPARIPTTATVAERVNAAGNDPVQQALAVLSVEGGVESSIFDKFVTDVFGSSTNVPGAGQLLIDSGKQTEEWVRNAGFVGFPSYAKGTDYHPGGPAYLHQNELINLPRGTSVSTAGEVREMVNEIKALRKSNENMALELRQVRKLAESRTNIAEDKRAEELQAAAEATA